MSTLTVMLSFKIAYTKLHIQKHIKKKKRYLLYSEHENDMDKEKLTYSYISVYMYTGIDTCSLL